jgi:uncharacterized membrane protein (DUF2068 family)
MKKIQAAAIVMLIHGGLIELGGCLALIPLLLFPSSGVGMDQYFSFVVPYFQDHLTLMMIIGGIYGILRIIAAVGLFKNRAWGLILSYMLGMVTLVLMPFMLPVGIIDGLLASASLVLLLLAYFGKRKIIDAEAKALQK